MTLRVLHWYPDFFHGGGVANAVNGLTAAQSRQGARVWVAAAAPSHAPLYQAMAAAPGVEVVTWRPARTLRIAGHTIRVAHGADLARLAALQPDVVHVHGEFNLDNLRVSRLFRCPVVISPHGACHAVVIEKSNRLAKRGYLAAENLLLRRHVRMFHALSPAEAKQLESVFPRITRYCAPEGPSVPVQNGAPRQQRLQAPPPGTRSITALFVGRLDVYTKGLDILLDAFAMAEARDRRWPLRLTLAGPDWKGGLALLRARAETLGIRDRVQFTGALTGSEVAAVLAAADIYVQLSRHEGFPLSVVDALLAGKPAVLSDAIGTISYPEIAALPHVRVVPPLPAPAVRAILQTIEALPESTGAARSSCPALIEFFSWDRVARLHLQQYDRLMRA
jgi:glycosyltransferase involved in cell wall biosynthesis